MQMFIWRLAGFIVWKKLYRLRWACLAAEYRFETFVQLACLPACLFASGEEKLSQALVIINKLIVLNILAYSESLNQSELCILRDSASISFPPRSQHMATE